mmetsp:Transcript_99203/g.309539  ORF Transcript_99203/g.309539 Transcript_99203/m.309539 type:complete len:428 (+) Transcript_99203:155-1438(+)
MRLPRCGASGSSRKRASPPSSPRVCEGRTKPWECARKNRLRSPQKTTSLRAAALGAARRPGKVCSGEPCRAARRLRHDAPWRPRARPSLHDGAGAQRQDLAQGRAVRRDLQLLPAVGHLLLEEAFDALLAALRSLAQRAELPPHRRGRGEPGALAELHELRGHALHAGHDLLEHLLIARVGLVAALEGLGGHGHALVGAREGHLEERLAGHLLHEVQRAEDARGGGVRCLLNADLQVGPLDARHRDDARHVAVLGHDLLDEAHDGAGVVDLDGLLYLRAILVCQALQVLRDGVEVLLGAPGGHVHRDRSGLVVTLLVGLGRGLMRRAVLGLRLRRLGFRGLLVLVRPRPVQSAQRLQAHGVRHELQHPDLLAHGIRLHGSLDQDGLVIEAPRPCRGAQGAASADKRQRAQHPQVRWVKVPEGARRLD